MDAEELPFSITPEARDQFLHFLDFIKSGHDRAHIPAIARGFPTLQWSIETLVNNVPVGPQIGLGMYRSLNDAGAFSFSLGTHCVWIGERTLSLMRGRTLIWERRQVPPPIRHHYCFWVEPAPDNI